MSEYNYILMLSFFVKYTLITLSVLVGSVILGDRDNFHPRQIESIHIDSTIIDTTFFKSTDLADSCWIVQLRKIMFPDVLKKDSLINVYFKYRQIINGYEVTGRWMPLESDCETGHLVMNFRNTISGQSFQYIPVEIYTNFNICQVIYSENFKGHRDQDVYYFEYISPDYKDSWKDSPIGYYSPFQFYDVDFDGEQELLISDWGQYQSGNHYDVYKIQNNGLQLIYYFPLNAIDNNTIFNPENRQISLCQFDGVADYCKVVFSKQPANIKKIIPRGLLNEGTTGGRILKEYYMQNKTNFKLDSLYQYFDQDSIFIYATINERLTLVEKQLIK